MQSDIESLFEKRIEEKKPFQIVFSHQSEQDLSQLSKSVQFQILDGIENLPKALAMPDSDCIGKAERDNRIIYRFRYKEYRIYFEKTDFGILIHRILLKNTLADFLFRSNLVFSETNA
ncbi:type II toxin-antitoxin system RelE/ParE family toxin [Methylacidiphilum caldifontis]|uniref:Addiction module toxin RelE n=1 Tax=Methylacidiphilum caldifontis TaxID=2795386 RepID=A0A4Y8PG23_9BACT|nr:type II toxin-antitoxin system RelE/ParE family toxin [Methylacidiphilum caldifontis]TFE70843.1 addiction module toxin RelE [Methylacidiphilum caldifontis]